MSLNFTTKITRTIISAVLIVLISGLVSAKTKQTGTIYLKDGNKHENVLFTSDKYFKIITIELEGKELKYSFSDIDRIYNENNEDITKEMIGRASSTEQVDDSQVQPEATQNLTQTEKKQAKIWESERSEAYQEARKKLWNTAFMISPTYTAPSGYYYKGTEGGISFAGNVMFAINRRIALRFHYSQPKIKLKAPFDFISTSTSRFLMQLQYNSYTGKVDTDKSMVYFYSGLGIVNDDLDSYFTMSLGGGLIKMMSEEVGLNFELGLDFPGIYDEEIEAILLDLRVGFAFVL